MKVNQFVTKIVLRVFFILLVAALVPFLQGDQNKLQHIYLSFHHWWEMIFPVILIASFITLLVTCMVKKYKEPELNWLLVVNTLVLIVYGVAVFIRVWQMV
jgi:quinol-cytochrome oxidoreductase complex cytochrome b subunit